MRTRTAVALMPDAIVLDSGAVIGYSRGSRETLLAIHGANRRKYQLYVPPGVITQTLRGGGRDTPIFRLLASCVVPPVDFELARMAGRLLGDTDTTDVVDAQVAAQAIQLRPCILLTSDVADLRRLLGGYPSVMIHRA
jgi:predicted nucleic acid-binding protein